jgi:YggT family protein
MFVLANLLNATAILLHYVLNLYMWIVIARAVISWVNPDPYNPIVRFLCAATDPVFDRLRRTLPLYFGGFDFSPIIVLFAIVFLDNFVVATLQQIAVRLQLP